MSYNGWTNYETWNAKLWIDNDQGSQEYWAERAQQIHNAAEADDMFTRQERATQWLADTLKDEHEENLPNLPASFYSDILNAALSEVNWYEIATSMIEETETPTEAEAES